MNLVSNMNIGKGENMSNGKEVEQLKQSNEWQSLKLEEVVMVVKDVKEELSKKTKQTDNHLEHKMEDMKNKYDGKIEDLHKVLELNEELTAMKLKVENMKSQMMVLEVRKMSEQEEIEDSKNRIAREREELRKEKEKLSFEKQELKAKSKELSMEREELMLEKQMIQFGIGFLKHEKEKSDNQKTSLENDTTDNIIGMFNTTSNDKSMPKEILKISQFDNSMVPKLFFSPSSSPVLRPKKNTPGTRSLPLESVTTPLSSSRPRREKRQTDFYSSPTSTKSPSGRRMRKSDKENISQSNEKSKTPRVRGLKIKDPHENRVLPGSADIDGRIVTDGDLIKYFTGYVDDESEVWLTANVLKMLPSEQRKYPTFYNIINENEENLSIELVRGKKFEVRMNDTWQKYY